MMKNNLRALLAILMSFVFLFGSSGVLANVPFPGDTVADFEVSSVYEEVGTSIVRLYGSSTRAATVSDVEFGLLTSTNGFASEPTFQPITGVVGYNGSAGNTAFVICPPGQACGGFAAFYIVGNNGSYKIYHCETLSNWKDLGGCSEFLTDMSAYDNTGLGLTEDGTHLLVAGEKAGDMHFQIHSLDIASAVAQPLPECTPALNAGIVNGSIAGSGANKYFYVSDVASYYRYKWNGFTCEGNKQLINGSLGWSDAIETPNDDWWAAVGPRSGTFYFSGSDGVLKFSEKDKSCNLDSFISSTEVCDPSAAVPLNGKSCTTIGQGFVGGTLACNPTTCGWDTSSCSLPASCGNGTKDGTDQCEGTDLGGATCASVVPGSTGVLGCTAGCTYDTTACQKCGNGVKEGSEACDGSDLGNATCETVNGLGYIGSLNCSSCTIDATACTKCGNGVIDSGEVCDGSLFGGKTCASEAAPGYTGVLACNECGTIDIGGCSPPTAFCGDGSCNGAETCGSCPTDCGVCCGNGQLDPGEACDGSQLGGQTCQSLVGEGSQGNLGCDDTCSMQTSACSPPINCGNGVRDFGEQCDGNDIGTHSCEDKGPGYTGTVTCAGNCVLNYTCVPPPGGIKVTSGDCPVVLNNPFDGVIKTISGHCEFEFISKNGTVANSFELNSNGDKAIPFKVAQLPARSSFTIPQGVIWKENDSKGNLKEFIVGAGVVLGDEGTGYEFDTLTSYPIVGFHDLDKIICFGLDSYENRFTQIDVGVGPGCLDKGWHVSINVETRELVEAPWKDGTGGSSGSAGSGGNDTGGNAGVSASGSGGSGGSANSVAPAAGSGGGCSCSVPAQEGIPSGWLLLLAIVVTRIPRRNRSK